MRNELVTLAFEVCMNLGICTTTKHASVYLFYHFADDQSIHHRQLCQATLTCIFLTSKFEETWGYTPTVAKLRGLIGRSEMDLRDMDVAILIVVDWNICKYL